MCISNINITTKLYKKIYNNDLQHFIETSFDTIVAKTQNGNKYIDDFSIAFSFNLLGTNDESKKSTNIVENKGKLFVKVQMCKLSKNPEHQLTSTLTTFDIDLSSKDIKFQQACVPYVIYDYVLNVKRLQLPESNEFGNYVIKVLIKTDENAEKWDIQSFYPLRIE